MKRKSILTCFFLALILLAIVILVLVFCIKNNNNDIKTVKSEKELIRLVKKENKGKITKLIFTLPYSLFFKPMDIVLNSDLEVANDTSIAKNDYSTTNIQVKNVDEADIVKTDGNYIYSLTDNEVVITKVLADGKIEITSKISSIGTPEDILIKDNHIVVISHNSYKENRTQIDIFDISDKASPKKIKHINTSFDYYTSRMINNNVYVFSSGTLEVDNNKKIKPFYSCDNKEVNIDYRKISYIKDKPNNELTSIISFDLNNIDDVSFNGMIINIDNAYISENNIYILENEYEGRNNNLKILDIFGYKGLLGFSTSNKKEWGNYTNIHKFSIDGKNINYENSIKEKGSALNQFSMDEYEGNLRIALNENSSENKLCIFDSNLKKIGELNNIAPGEKIYSTRFIGDKAYMVTFKTMDPLFVIDVSNPTNPKVLGELKIPGYSTYLHSYDENHIIGIGNDTQTEVIRDYKGKVISERTTITGMKMALFDVSDVNNPKELFSTKIGDSKTYSSILENHKALLFSKEKNLLAIPINNYNSDINVTFSSDNISDSDISRKILSKKTKNGYLVYNISIEKGFEQKGMITHDATGYSAYYKGLQDIRGIYINDVLYTISNKYIKANKLNNLEELSTLKIQ